MRVLSIYHSNLHSKENSSTAEQRLGNGVGVEWGSGEGKMEGGCKGCKGGKGRRRQSLCQKSQDKEGVKLVEGDRFLLMLNVNVRTRC